MEKKKRKKKKKKKKDKKVKRKDGYVLFVNKLVQDKNDVIYILFKFNVYYFFVHF